DKSTRPVYLVAEVEEEPANGNLYRMGHYELLLAKEVNPECDPAGPRVGSLLLNLTGTQQVREVNWDWPDPHGMRVAPLIVNGANQEALPTLARVDAKEFGPEVLPYIVLMRGGNQQEVIDEWPKVALRHEQDVNRLVQLRDAALVFAELTRYQADWLKALENW